ncbi:HD domain-containing phosphohydrolase [Thiomicrorhabdus sediminis]|uniref:Response regulator n=1 Tax=Thiomicrorhabdus sediminis TaxID=2580412 RepID=A0A4V1HHR1_9GAMM|nr:HD domain-containing phosphohydrolase [Thiomicrorhabdus sediminis]QCU89903.1 response regulator [Thiomicrorhabdus sediminis]
MKSVHDSNDCHTAKIMVVDDEPVNLKLVDRILRSQGYGSIVLESDPRNVLALYKSEMPDLILLDINMPYLDGYQVMEQLKALNDPLLPPIVILTAQSSEEFLLKALQLGAQDFLVKPFNVNEMVMRVRNFLQSQLAHKALYNQKALLEAVVQERTEELHHTRLQVVQRLGKAAEYRDEETGYHILRMSHMCAHLAKSIGWDDYQCDLVLNASPMHDIGKIGIPDSVLLKPGKLDAEEWKIMQSHTTIGARMLEGDDSDLIKMAREIALTHHEKWDGSGYPNGLAGDSIPLVGRIAAIADVFDALTSERPYKKAWSVEDAVSLIKESSGKHFDPELVEVFEQVLPEMLQIKNQFQEKEIL